MKKKIVFFSIFCLTVCVVIGWIFWQIEFKYSLPTPLPTNFKIVNLGEHVQIQGINPGRSSVLHFFNPECPCSKFNINSFKSLEKKYRNEVAFYVVLQSEDEDEIQKFRNRYEIDLPVILDHNGSISDQCGIYSTPQAVVLDKNSSIYFKGNYNKSRFCTRKETNYVQIALDSMIRDKPLPLFVRNELTLPYGCVLPSDETQTDNTFANLLNAIM
jgi:hypothetical protein